MKILLITRNIHVYTGYGRYAQSLAKYAKEAGHEVRTVVHETTPNAIVPEIVLLDEPQKYFLNPLHILQGARKIARVMREWQPDVVHVAVESYGHMLPFLPKTSAKCVVTVHGTYAYIPRLITENLKHRLAEMFTRAMYRRANKIIAVSNFTKTLVLEKLQKMPQIADKITVIYSGVDTASDSQRSIKEFPNGVPTLLLVGAVIPRKGVVEAIQAVSAYQETYKKKIRLIIVGKRTETDPYDREVVELIKQLHLDETVVLTGRVSDEVLERYYTESSVFLMPSLNRGEYFEGFGLVYIEANMHGLPTIGPRESGASEAIADGISGFLVDPRNADEIASRLNELLSEPSTYLRMSKSAREWANNFLWKEQIKKYIAVYSS